jgi:anti-anti-sigma factor
MSDSPVLRFGSTETGFVIRLEGRGTLHESPSLLAYAEHLLQRVSSKTVVLDLECCEYLDSTCLGTLVSLHQRFGSPEPPQFLVSGSSEAIERLLSPTRLDQVLALVDAPPDCPGEWLEIPTTSLERQEFCRHLMDCHRRLAELGGPRAAAFHVVADELAKELGDSLG